MQSRKERREEEGEEVVRDSVAVREEERGEVVVRREEREEVVGGMGVLGWGLVVATIAVVSGSALAFVQRSRSSRSRRSRSRGSSSLGVGQGQQAMVDGEDDRYSCYDDVFLTTLEEDIII